MAYFVLKFHIPLTYIKINYNSILTKKVKSTLIQKGDNKRLTGIKQYVPKDFVDGL
jgi:hypothetical protein